MEYLINVVACDSGRKSGWHHSYWSSTPLTLVSEMFAADLNEKGNSVARYKHLTIRVAFL